tara:strand:+ start:94 stop:375 length:282 start_codon:yes stop_codon:yes gene_type:complete
MIKYNKKRYSNPYALTYGSIINDNVKLVEHNQENIQLLFEAITQTKKLIEYQYKDLKQEILENKELHKFFDIKKIRVKGSYHKAHNKTLITKL